MINLRAYHTSLLLGLILLVQLAIVSSAPFDEPKSDEPDIPVLQHFTKNRPKRVNVRRPSRKSGRTKSSDSEPGADKSSTDIGSMSPEPSVISQEPVTPEDTPHHPHSSHARRPFVRSASNTLEFKSEKYQNHNQHRRIVSCEVYPNLGEHTEHSMSNKSAPATPVKNEVPIFRSESIASIKSESHESPAKNSQSKPPTSSNVKSTPIQPNVIFQLQPSGTYGGASDTKQSGSTTMRSSFWDKKYILAIFLTVSGVVIIALFVFISILVYNRQKRNPVIPVEYIF